MPTIPIKQGVEVSPRAGGLSLIPQQRLLQGPSVADGIAAVAEAFKSSIHDDDATTQLRLDRHLIEAQGRLTVLQQRLSLYNNPEDDQDISQRMEASVQEELQGIYDAFPAEYHELARTRMADINLPLKLSGVTTDVKQKLESELIDLETIKQQAIIEAGSAPTAAAAIAEAHIAKIMGSNQPTAGKKQLAIAARSEILGAAYGTAYFNQLFGPETPGEDYGDLAALEALMPPGLAAQVRAQVQAANPEILEQRARGQATLLVDTIRNAVGGDLRAALKVIEQHDDLTVRHMAMEMYLDEHNDLEALEIFNSIKTIMGDQLWNERAIYDFIDTAVADDPELRKALTEMYRQFRVNHKEWLDASYERQAFESSNTGELVSSLSTADQLAAETTNPRIWKALREAKAALVTADNQERDALDAQAKDSLQQSLDNGVGFDSWRKANPDLYQNLSRSGREAYMKYEKMMLERQSYAIFTNPTTASTIGLMSDTELAQLQAADVTLLKAYMTKDDHDALIRDIGGAKARVTANVGGGSAYDRATAQAEGLFNDMEMDSEDRIPIFRNLNVFVMNSIADQEAPPADFETQVAAFLLRQVTPVTVDPPGRFNEREALFGEMVILNERGEYVPTRDFTTTELNTAIVDHDWLEQTHQLRLIEDYFARANEITPYSVEKIEQVAGALLLNDIPRLRRLLIHQKQPDPFLAPDRLIVAPQAGEEAGRTTVYSTGAR